MRSGGRWLAGAALCLALGAGGCGGGFTEKDACGMVKEFLAAKAGYELHDAYRNPPVRYRNVEIVECYGFESDSDRGWARIHVRAIGDEYEAQVDRLLERRKEFSPTFEFDRYDQGWKIVE